MNARARRLTRETALTIGASLGVLCVTIALAAPLLGMRLVVFKSGSMGPDIDTGALAITRTVDAGDVAVGDVVSVTSAKGTRITHRVTQVVADGDQVLLELKGDANAKADDELYPVTEVDRVGAHMNGVGYVVDALASPYAIFGAGAGAAALLVLTFRRRTPDDRESSGPRSSDPGTGPFPPARRTSRVRRSHGLMLAVVAGVVTVGVIGGGTLVSTLAAFSDSPKVGALVTSMTVPSPSGTVGCANGGAFSGTVHLQWPAVADPPSPFRYRVEVYKTDPAHPVATYTTTTPEQDVRRDDGLEGNSAYHVRVSGEIDGSTWRSAGSIERTISTGLMGYDINC